MVLVQQPLGLKGRYYTWLLMSAPVLTSTRVSMTRDKTAPPAALTVSPEMWTRIICIPFYRDSVTPAPQPAPAPVPGQQTNIVQLGDTLSGIARCFHTTVEAQTEKNGITNPNLIIVGQKLII